MNQASDDAGLQNRLEAALFAEFERLGIDPYKTNAAAPTGEENAVFDLSCFVEDADGPGGNPPSEVVLTWTEQLVGDYDQNRLVGVSDLTPLGANFLETVDYDPAEVHMDLQYWPNGSPYDTGAGIGDPPVPGSGARNWRLARVDGDRNGELNVSDITPIAVHWEQRFDGYRVYRIIPGDPHFQLLPNPTAPGSPFTVVATAQVPNGPVTYSFSDTDIGSTPVGWWEYYVAPYDSVSDTEGPRSNYAGIDVDQGSSGGYRPVAIVEADPAAGSPPLVVNFYAGNSYDYDGWITKYEWDMDNDPQGGYEYDSGLDPTLQMTYNTPGTKIQFMRVTDNNGLRDRGYAKVQVTYPSGNIPPLAELRPSQYIAEAPASITWFADGSTDEDGSIVKYEWDMDGDTTAYEYDSGTDPTLQMNYTTGGTHRQYVRVTDDQGATDIAWAAVQINGDVAQNEPPVASFTVDHTGGGMGIVISFDASASTDPDGTIQQYDWDYEGDGTIDYTSSTPTTSFQYTISGLYDATLTVTDDQGATDTSSLEILISGEGLYTVDDTPLRLDGSLALAEVDSRPAIAYGDWLDNDLRYIRAANRQGSAWGSSQVIDSGGSEDVGRVDSLIIADGHPAITYYAHSTPPKLLYIRAEDSQGSNWPENPVVVDDSEIIPFPIGDAMIIGNHPAVAYVVDFDPSPSTDYRLMFKMADDPAGTSWPSRTIVAPTEYWNHKLIELPGMNGTPGIMHVSASGEIIFERATSGDGTSWGAPMLISGVADSAHRIACGYVNGVPTVVYTGTDVTAVPGVFIQQSSSPDGSSWIIPPTRMESGYEVGEIAMATIAGFPAVVSHLSHFPNSWHLYYHLANDAGGYLWPNPPWELTDVDEVKIRMIEMDGRPGIAYTNWAGGQNTLHYVTIY